MLIIFSLLGSFQIVGQNQDIYQRYNIHRSWARVKLNKLSWTLTSGYACANYKHNLSGFLFYQNSNGQYILPNNTTISTPFQGYINWLNNPLIDTVGAAFLNPKLQGTQFLANSDTTEIGFRGISHGIPITFQLSYNFMEKFRIGVGYSWEKQFIKALLPTNYEGVIRPYQPNISSTTYTRLFGTVGYKFYAYYEHLFVAELQVGKIKSGSGFNQGAIQRSMYFNLGLSIEKQLSEYFRIILKPSIDFKDYKVSIPGGMSITHQQPSLFLQVGVSINIPEIPRSPIANDHIQVKHVVTDPRTGRLIEVRGQPITKWQNPKVGQNHRTLFRYKKKNRNKLNPY